MEFGLVAVEQEAVSRQNVLANTKGEESGAGRERERARRFPTWRS